MTDTLPLITLVTPSFNQREFLPATIQSVLGQKYPRLKYIIMDGGSTDGSIDIIRQCADQLHYWSAGKDDGQYDAINRGFAKGAGEVMGWLNADDLHTPWTLSVVGEIFATLPEVEWLTSLFPLSWDTRGRAVRSLRVPGFSRAGFRAGENLRGRGWYSQGWIQQESTFWRRSIWEKAGGKLDTDWSLAADFALWDRFFNHTELYGVETPLAGFRTHAAQKTASQFESYREQARQILERSGGRHAGAAKAFVRRHAPHLIPESLRPFASHFGLVRRAKAILPGKDNQGWRVAETWH